MIKKIIFILALLVFFGAGLYVGYQYMPKETSQSEEVAQTETQTQAGLDYTKMDVKEKIQLYNAAHQYIKEYSAEGMITELEFIKLLDKWALLKIIPVNIETDVANIIMEKVNGQWEAKTFGTILPGWKEKVPELFE